MQSTNTTTNDGSHEAMHGVLGSREWAAPVCVTEFDVNARLSFTSIKAHEYNDTDAVLREKVGVLAGLLRKAKACCAYTGAGISTAAGIDDYATKAKDQSVTAEDRPVVKDWKMARPTKAHYVMTALHEKGFLHHWVQQNHDSLPQKAGYPQHALNEIHGSLHDPGNPVVPYEGVLRDDLYDWLQEWEAKNDLCLAMGTSLSGFNADRIPERAARRFRKGLGQGLVIINLQQTPMDEVCSLRLFAKIDTVMEMLAEELGISDAVKPMGYLHQPKLPSECIVQKDVFSVPFDMDGTRSETGGRIVWDLREGSTLMLTGGPHEGDIGRVMGKNEDGHYRIRFENSFNRTLNMKMRPFSLWLGNWWIEEAAHGFGIVPGGKVPFVTIVTADEAEKSTAVPAIKPALCVRTNPNAPPPPPLPKKSSGKMLPAMSLNAVACS
jgi:NAD-dependent SIR2 family protein deacetylase